MPAYRAQLVHARNAGPINARCYKMATITDKTGKMHNPMHPGEILRELHLVPPGVTVTQAAKALGVSRRHVSTIVNGRTPVTPDMALRLAAVFRTEPELWAVSKKARPKVKPLVTRKAA